MSKLFLVLSLLIFSVSVSAQSDSSSTKVSYFLSMQSGGLLGKKGIGASLTTSFMNGIRFKRLSAAAGVGYDVYPEWRAVPFFGSVGLDVIKKRNHAFSLNVQSGYAKAWNPEINEQQSDYSQEGGFLFHPFAGYRLTSGNMTISFTAGYKLQNLRYVATPRWQGWGNRITVDRDMERLSIQMGIGFR